MKEEQRVITNQLHCGEAYEYTIYILESIYTTYKVSYSHLGKAWTHCPSQSEKDEMPKDYKIIAKS